MILREKNLSEEDYQRLARQAMEICQENGVRCILHQFVNVARALDWKMLHVPLCVLRSLTEEERREFSVLGTSCHSPWEAMEAETLGCTYLTAGHVFDTACKQGMPGRGIEFLRRVCESVSIPVYAIGGIHPGNVQEILMTGAAGACVMSGMMTCENAEDYLAAFQAVKLEGSVQRKG